MYGHQKRPPKGHRLFVIGTTSNIDVLEQALKAQGITSARSLAAHLRLGVAGAEVREAVSVAGGELHEVLQASRQLLGAHLVFTYGSLLSGLSNHRHIENSKRIETSEIFTTTDMFTMVSASPAREYPYALEVGDSRPTDTPCVLKGEVYIVDDEVMARLDWLEDHPNLYKRRRVTIEGVEERAWIYILEGRDSMDCVRAIIWEHPQVIPHGDWKSFVLNTN